MSTRSGYGWGASKVEGRQHYFDNYRTLCGLFPARTPPLSDARIPKVKTCMECKVERARLASSDVTHTAQILRHLDREKYAPMDH